MYNKGMTHNKPLTKGTTKMTTATAPKTAMVNGKTYSIRVQQDMSKLPGMSGHIRDIYYLEGKRGAAYMLQVYHNGTFEMFDSGMRIKASGEWE
jgi:hypothetical protein